jgi:hypothetical protein
MHRKVRSASTGMPDAHQVMRAVLEWNLRVRVRYRGRKSVMARLSAGSMCTMWSRRAVSVTAGEERRTNAGQ